MIIIAAIIIFVQQPLRARSSAKGRGDGQKPGFFDQFSPEIRQSNQKPGFSSGRDYEAIGEHAGKIKRSCDAKVDVMPAQAHLAE